MYHMHTLGAWKSPSRTLFQFPNRCEILCGLPTLTLSLAPYNLEIDSLAMNCMLCLVSPIPFVLAQY